MAKMRRLVPAEVKLLFTIHGRIDKVAELLGVSPWRVSAALRRIGIVLPHGGPRPKLWSAEQRAILQDPAVNHSAAARQLGADRRTVATHRKAS